MMNTKTKLNEVKKRLEQFTSQSSLTAHQHAFVVCLKEAIQAGIEGNYSVGATITDGQCNILSQGRNTVFKPIFRSEAHAEMNAITQFEEAFTRFSKDGVILFSTLEPCMMCTARILFCGIKKVIFLQKDETGGICHQLHLLPSNYRELSEQVQFVEYAEKDQLKTIAKELYVIGEEIWNHEYQLRAGAST